MDACGRLEISFLPEGRSKGRGEHGARGWRMNREPHWITRIPQALEVLQTNVFIKSTRSAEEWKGECLLQAHNQNFARIWIFFVSSYCRCRFLWLCTSSVDRVVSTPECSAEWSTCETFTGLVSLGTLRGIAEHCGTLPLGGGGHIWHRICGKCLA